MVQDRPSRSTKEKKLFLIMEYAQCVIFLMAGLIVPFTGEMTWERLAASFVFFISGCLTYALRNTSIRCYELYAEYHTPKRVCRNLMMISLTVAIASTAIWFVFHQELWLVLTFLCVLIFVRSYIDYRRP